MLIFETALRISVNQKHTMAAPPFHHAAWTLQHPSAASRAFPYNIRLSQHVFIITDLFLYLFAILLRSKLPAFF